MKKVQEVEIDNKTVFLRADLDVSLEPLDDFRLKAWLPTLNYLLGKNCKVVLAGYLGRPGGKIVGELRAAPIADWLRSQGFSVKYTGEILPINQHFREDFTGEIILLENLRFDPREEKSDLGFARQLANLADVFVFDAFANAHRDHASTVTITQFLPSFAGLHLQKEIEELSKVLKNPTRPLLFILGGAKSETRLPLVKAFSRIANTILLGGTLTFEKSLEGVPKVRFPLDAIRVDDIGPRSIELFKNYIGDAQTIVWNGPLGKFEEEKFAQGTKVIAKALLNSHAKVIIGGGDTISALKKFNLFKKAQSLPNVFLSTGGGAMLTFLAQQKMPALEVLGFKW